MSILKWEGGDLREIAMTPITTIEVWSSIGKDGEPFYYYRMNGQVVQGKFDSRKDAKDAAEEDYFHRCQKELSYNDRCFHCGGSTPCHINNE